MAPDKGFSWLGNDVAITSHISNSGYKSGYCPDCGSPVPNKFRDYPLYSVPVGSIDGSPNIEVVAQLYLDSSASWEKEQLQGDKFGEMPELEAMLKLLHAQM